MVLLLALGPVLLPEYRDPTAGRLDLLSAGLSLASVLLAIYGVKQIAEHGLGAVPALVILAGLVTGLVFLARQRTLPDPFIDVSLFADRRFSASLATNAVGVFAVFGVYLFIPQYYQLVAGLSPFEAGLLTVPGAIVSIAGSMLAPVLARRYRTGAVVFTGLVVAVVGFGLLTVVDTASLVTVVTSCVVMMIGFGLVVTLTVDMIIAAAPEERAGAASAISETGSELGGALGIAVLGSVLAATYSSSLGDALAGSTAPAEAVARAQESLPAAMAIAERIGPRGADLVSAAGTAFSDGLSVALLVAAAVMVAGALVVYLRGPRSEVATCASVPSAVPPS
jgi:DHA2 family multidrug resistance protein-like MFS transporter